MKTLKETVKSALLLSPHRLLDNKGLIQILQIIKGNNGAMRYEAGEVNMSDVRALFPGLPKGMVSLFREFTLEGKEEAVKEIKQRHTKQKAGIAYGEYLRIALLRHYHQLFEQLKPFASLVKWYYTKQINGNKHYSTAPCLFSVYRPQLYFEVTLNGNSFKLSTNISINGTPFPLSAFLRQHFLLESGNEFFLLSFKDYQTLEWLESREITYTDSAQMVQQLLSVLEKDYTVNRNDLFGQQEIVVAPVKRVMLNELSNTFLMLTPQWLYDGFLVEGGWKETSEFVVHGEAYVIRRNKEQEQELIQLLESLHPNFSKQSNGYYYLSFADAQKKQWFLKAYHQLLVTGIELTGMDMLKHFRYSPHTVETEIKVLNETDTSVTLQVKTRFDAEEILLSELQKMLMAGQRAVLLKDGSLGVLGEDWLRQYASIIKHGKVNKNELTIARWMTISTRQEQQLDGLPSMKKEWWQRWQQWQDNTSDQPVYTLPVGVKAKLRPYQQKGFEWMMLLAEAGAGGCLADDMGLGKTLQAICFMVRQIDDHPQSKQIIVCPSSLIYNWQQEIQKFAPGINTLVYHGNQRNAEQLLNNDVQVIITSYGTLRVDAENLLALAYAVAIIDESHNIKNPSAQITKAVSSINARICFALSGTPVVNNTFDLYSQLNAVIPGMLGSREFFKREYADAIDRYGDADKIQALQKLTAPFILRRTKEQAAPDLPEKTESILWCEMASAQRGMYETIKEQIRSSLFLDIKAQGLAKTKLAVIQGILKLRQVCNSPLLLPEDERTSNESVKTTLLLEELKNILPSHKALVFSQFSTLLDLLAVECKKKGIAFYHFDGQTPPAKRAEMVNAFQEEGNTTNLFLISLKAGNTGLTLTAADYVFLFDPWWNTAVQQQAIDRTHRIGQTKNVFAYKMICKDTIEEKIVRLQERKKQLAEDLVSADEGFVKALSEEDISYLFE
jgi:SNF2 family DNA or RNA helicase